MADELNIKVGQRFRKLGGDYQFEGRVVSVFRKLPSLTSEGSLRMVGQDDRGLLFIFDPNRVEFI